MYLDGDCQNFKKELLWVSYKITIYFVWNGFNGVALAGKVSQAPQIADSLRQAC